MEETKKCQKCGEVKLLNVEINEKSFYCKKCVHGFYLASKEKHPRSYDKRDSEYMREYNSRRRKNDFEFKLVQNMRNLIGSYIKKRTGKIMDKKLVDVLGCSFDFFLGYIEKQFEPWMSWDNYGGRYKKDQETEIRWEIDHIIEMQTAKTDEEVYKLNHYTNLRPRDQVTNRKSKRKVRNKNTKGYYYNKTNKRYLPTIIVNGKSIYLGCYKTEEEAKEAYAKALLKYDKINS